MENLHEYRRTEPLGRVPIHWLRPLAAAVAAAASSNWIQPVELGRAFGRVDAPSIDDLNPYEQLAYGKPNAQ